ncbi:Fur family transcriptional regulator, ferric uptake regulator [Ruaniaceae bacterium KH17]|nr:Fur family transcriptional regulator, ferric uptake regulator [Ruaniaceae bacterium KH17]
MTSVQFDERLRAAGLRVTAPRLTALAVIGEQQHIDVETLASAVRERLGTVSKQAVYDVVHVLTDAGLVRRVSPDGRGARYELERWDNHHHLLCSQCGELIDVPCAVDHVPCLMPPDSTGLTIDTAEVIYHGLCPDCTLAARDRNEISDSESTKELR